VRSDLTKALMCGEDDLGLIFQGKRIRDFKVDSRGVCEFKSGAFA
jgi:hypothetical protein